MTEQKPQNIELERLIPHPQNPRLYVREEVVNGIATQLSQNGEFDPAYALLVRPLDVGRYQIIQGHHRILAARKVGLDAVPCWVRQMTDDEAYMELLLGNIQDGIGPLEIGMHALGLEQHEGGRGIGGGLSEYARQVGRSQQYISELRDAAEVLSFVKPTAQAVGLADKAKHLHAIHKAPRELWPLLVERMLKEGWSAADTEQEVKHIRRLHIPPKWQEIFLPFVPVIERRLSNDTVNRLVTLTDGMEALIKSYDVDHDRFIVGLHEWLSRGIGDYAWDVRRVVEYQRQLQAQLAKAERIPPMAWLADYREWLPEQESCDLLLTDPPYMTDVEDIESFAQEWLPLALSKVKPTGRAYVFIGAYPQELKAYLNVPVPDHLTLENVLVWTYRNTLGPTPSHNYKLNWNAALYFKGVDAGPLNCPIMTEQFAVQDVNAPDGRIGTRLHKWQKPIELAKRLIAHSTSPDDIILDPFTGTGTFILAASNQGRVGRGCDNNEEILGIAVHRGCVLQ